MRQIAIPLLLVLAASLARGQDHTTDASFHRSRMLLHEARLPRPEEVRVYDFVNYHHHDLPPADAHRRVVLDLAALRPDLAEGDTQAHVQIGISTWTPSVDELAPVNLAVVIDGSGSMACENKMGFVKRGLEILASHLDSDDVLSIVVFNNGAEVVRAGSPVADRDSVVALLSGIEPRGGTNLHAGLMLGYGEVAKNRAPGRSDLVILLSDGQANFGTTDLETIVSDSLAWNEEGIALTTIGIGLDFADPVMNQLAKAAGGTYHFLDSPEGIERTFLHELTSLLGLAGREPRLRLELAPGVHLSHAYGYEVREAQGALEFPSLLDFPVSMTQVLPIDLSVKAGFDASTGPLARAILTYVDPRTNESMTETIELSVRRRLPGELEGPSTPSVEKNRTLAQLGEAFREACLLAYDERIPTSERVLQAEDVLDRGILRAQGFLGSGQGILDPDLGRMLDIVVRARQALRGQCPDPG